MASLTKWHINKKGEVHPCRARTGNCQFGGDSGKENHFSSRESAELHLAKANSEFSALGTQRKRAPLELNRAKPETKAAVETLLDKGFSVSSTKTLENLTVHAGGFSEVDILEEELKPFPLDVLKSKKRPF